VDLVHDGRIDLFFSDQEIEEARCNRDAKVNVGWLLDGVVALDKKVEAIGVWNFVVD